jgi:hypothetical protein
VCVSKSTLVPVKEDLRGDTMRNLAVYVITLLFIFVLYSSLAYAKIYVGVDNAGEVISETFKSDLWWECLELLGVDFVSYHYAPKTNSVDAMRDVITFTKKAELHDVQIVLNLEAANWRASHIDSTGFDWTKWTDGTHRFRFRDDIIGMFVASPAFLGVIYDEAAHMQLTRNLKVPGNPPFLAETQGMDFEQAYDVVEKSASDMIDVYKQAGVEFVASEHVWPALFHICPVFAGSEKSSSSTTSAHTRRETPKIMSTAAAKAIKTRLFLIVILPPYM